MKSEPSMSECMHPTCRAPVVMFRAASGREVAVTDTSMPLAEHHFAGLFVIGPLASYHQTVVGHSGFRERGTWHWANRCTGPERA